MTDTLTVERNEITEIHESTLSIMPEALLESLPRDDARDLISYLMHKTQVPLPTAANSSSN